jgi:rhodanese-related sulfurtransferase
VLCDAATTLRTLSRGLFHVHFTRRLRRAGTLSARVGISPTARTEWRDMTTTTLKTISKENLYTALTRGDRLQLVNVLEPEHYGLGSIRGSLRIPLSELDRRMEELDRSVDVVTYCASTECPMSRQAAERLAQKGFNVRAYEGGIKEWKSAGLPTN